MEQISEIVELTRTLKSLVDHLQLAEKSQASALEIDQELTEIKHLREQLDQIERSLKERQRHLQFAYSEAYSREYDEAIRVRVYQHLKQAYGE